MAEDIPTEMPDIPEIPDVPTMKLDISYADLSPGMKIALDLYEQQVRDYVAKVEMQCKIYADRIRELTEE